MHGPPPTSPRADSNRPRGGGPPGGSAFDEFGRPRRRAVDAPTRRPSAFTPTPDGRPASANGGTTAGPRAFPGGTARLPRLDGGEPCGTTTGGRSGRAGHDDAFTPAPPCPDNVGFQDYFSAESLFSTEAQPEAESTRETDGALAALGVDADATWEEIVSAHRSLVKKFHPDAVATTSVAEHAEAEERIRKINEAYDLLNRRRRRNPAS